MPPCKQNIGYAHGNCQGDKTGQRREAEHREAVIHHGHHKGTHSYAGDDAGHQQFAEAAAHLIVYHADFCENETYSHQKEHGQRLLKNDE